MRRIITCVLSLCVMGIVAQPPVLKPARTRSSMSGAVEIPVERVIDGRQSGLRSTSEPVDLITREFPVLDSTVVDIRKEKGQVIVLEKKRTTALRALRVDTGFVRQETSDFLAASPGIFNITCPENVRVNRVEVDNRGTLTGRGEQVFQGFAIYGTDFTFNISSDTERFTGRMVSEENILSSSVSLDVELALKIVKKDLSAQTKVRDLTGAELKLIGNKQAIIDTIYYPVSDGRYILSYQIRFRPNLSEEWIYFLSATNGSILSHYNNTKGSWKKTTYSGEDLNDDRRAIHTAYDGEMYYLYNLAEVMYDEQSGSSNS